MQIGLQTWGSYGDIRPFIALAAGLKSCGHEVTLVVTSADGIDYGESASRLGIRLIDVASHAIVVKENDAETGRLFINEENLVNQVKLILANLFLPVEAEMYRAAEQLCHENDMIIGHSFHYPIQAAAEKYGRHYVTVTLNPSVIPTSNVPPVGLPNLGKRANIFFWQLARRILNKKVKPYIDKLRRQNGMAAAGDLISDVWLSHELNLIAVTREICGFFSNWSDIHQVCGFFDIAHVSREGYIDERVERFLECGAPPVYMTFGSLVPENIQAQTEVAQLFTEAADLTRCRAIIQTSLWKDCGFLSSEDILYVAKSPHALVFPRCAAVVHHGGAGTTQAAMAAGIPSIVIPHFGDQFFWGREMKRLGIAPELLSRKKMTKESLAGRIELALSSVSMKTRAREVGISMRKEDGVATAVRLIGEKYQG